MNTTHRLTDRAAFLTALRASGVLTPGQFEKAVAALPSDAPTAARVAEGLVAAGFLTRFQADRLLTGRTDGFVLGQYVIQEQVGRGSVGRVYRAHHRSMNRAVAIKVLSPEVTRTDAARQAFRREVRAAARLNHPNIVTAYDANEVGDRSYLVMEFVDGPTLDALVRQRGPLPAAEACELVRQVALGLQHAHEQGMVHRDIKPHNLLVTRASKVLPGCVVKIADFGIARLAPPAASAAQSPRAGLLGTPDYVAPEQARHPLTADHRADLYSLGCVLYFLLTGGPPFPGGTAEDKVRRHQSEEPVPVGRLRPDVPPAVAEVVHRLLAKDPAARLRSAAELAAWLGTLAVGVVPAGGGDISFDLPSHPSGTYSSTSGCLTGVPAATETSPWTQLTDEAMAAGADLASTPLPAGLTRRAPARRPGWAHWVGLLALGGTVLAGCGFAIGLLLSRLAR